MRAPRSARAVLAWVIFTVTAAFTLVAAPTADAATTTTYTITTTVNVRTSKSNSAAIVGRIVAGKHVLAVGKVKSGWLPIKFNATTAYIAAKYTKKDAKKASIVITGPVGKKTSIMSVPIRTDAKITALAVQVAPKGIVMKVTGETSGIYTRVSFDDVSGWASTRRLTKKTVVLPDTVASYTTTAKLALRTTASASAANQVTVPVGVTVQASGVHSGSYSQVVYKASKVGWVITGYLKAVAGTDEKYVLPMRATTVYATEAARLLATAAADATEVGAVALGATLRGTGKSDGGLTAVIWNGTVAWIASASVTVSLGSPSLDKLESNGKAAVIEIRPRFPQLTAIYGWRASSSYSSDHPNGRAVDFMIPSYKTNKALGDALAAYVIAKGPRLNVTYVIWQQRIYTLASGKWRAMEDRGGDAANHYDHVHVSFLPSS